MDAISEDCARQMEINKGNAMSFPTGEMPSSIRCGGMQGILSYDGSGYQQTYAIGSGRLSVCGELVVTRENGDLLKVYSWAVAVDESGGYYFHGPFKGPDVHHQPLSEADRLLGFGQVKGL